MAEPGGMVTARVSGLSAIGPGFDDWATLRGCLAAAAPLSPEPTRIPVPEGLPPAERRRVGKVVKLALGAGLAACRDAGVDPGSVATVFASSGGDGENCHAICELLAGEDRLISPIRFHNSVNNAASGYWGIATGAQTGSSVVSAYDGSFAAGLIEAFGLLGAGDSPVLLVTYDHPYPPPLAQVRPLGEAFAVGMLLTGDGVGPGLKLGELAPVPADGLRDPVLEDMRLSIPAARSLPLLQALASGGRRSIALESLKGQSLVLEVEA